MSSLSTHHVWGYSLALPILRPVSVHTVEVPAIQQKVLWSPLGIDYTGFHFCMCSREDSLFSQEGLCSQDPSTGCGEVCLTWLSLTVLSLYRTSGLPPVEGGGHSGTRLTPLHVLRDPVFLTSHSAAGKVAGGSMFSSVQDSKQFRFCTFTKAVTTYFAYDGLNACASQINAISALKSDSHALCLIHYRRYTFLPNVSSSSFHPLAFSLNT